MGAVLLHTLKNDALAETYIHEPGGTCPVLRTTADGDIRFILPDQNDAPSEEVGSDGTLVWTARKGTWGEGFNAVGASGGEPALGQWYDAESGLHYNFFRYFDPDVARFLSPDPIDLLGGLNAYLAVSDPYAQRDRFGLTQDGHGCGGTDAPGKKPPATPAADNEEHASSDLHAKANAARDSLAADLAKARHPPATAVGAYSPSTGEFTAAASRGGGLGCAEGACAAALGNPADIKFTTAVRPRTGQPVDVCTTCESTWGRGAFPDPATRFQSDRAKE